MYRLLVATPEQVIFDGPVQSTILPGSEGFFEVLTNHTPIISLLKRGKLVFRDADNHNHTYMITGGFFEFSKNQGTLLADGVD